MAKKVAELSDGLKWSKSRLAAVSGVSRETVGKRLDQAGVGPIGIEQKHPVFDPRIALPVIFNPGAGTSAFTDPNDLSPKERKDWFDSERLRLEVEARNGELVPLADYTGRISGILQSIAGVLDRMAGDLEKELDWTPAQTDAFDRALDQGRRLLQENLEQLVAEDESGADTA